MYTDHLYGDIHFSEVIQELSSSSLMQRLIGISQGVLPQECMVYDVPSRYEHCHGVAYLAQVGVWHGDVPDRYRRLLPIAGLLHDAGNPPLSHLGEYFLYKRTGLDGESHLATLLPGTDTDAILRRHGYSIVEVVRIVVGKDEPYSRLINGSMDVDNLDNVLRYWFAAKGERLCDSEKIARAFRFGQQDKQWYLDDADGDVFEEVQRWQSARRSVYGLIYDEPHLGAAAMVYHAVDLADSQGELTDSFFRLTDNEALDVLLLCNPDTAHLVERAILHNWYDRIFEITSTKPDDPLAHVCASKDSRGVAQARRMVEEFVRERTGVPTRAFCVYAGRGKDVRQITLPFLGPNGAVHHDSSNSRPPNRLIAYLDPDAANKYRKAIVRCLEQQFKS